MLGATLGVEIQGGSRLCSRACRLEVLECRDLINRIHRGHIKINTPYLDKHPLDDIDV
jgi:hypothetical protein